MAFFFSLPNAPRFGHHHDESDVLTSNVVMIKKYAT
jgi:hypothetical protein